MEFAKLYPGGVVKRPVETHHMHEPIGRLIISKPDEAIAKLHLSNYSSFTNTESFEFKKEVIKNCIRLYGNFYNWLIYQLTVNKFVHGMNQEFLIDTLWYIKTGERKMMLPVWESLITQYPDTGSTKATRLDDATLESFLRNSVNKVNPISNYISEWTSHPDGIYDMLYTTYLLFGKADIGVLNKMNFAN